MKGFQVCTLAVLGSLLGVQPALAQIGGGNERKVTVVLEDQDEDGLYIFDNTAGEVLDASGLKYNEDDSLYKLLIETRDGRRQKVFVSKQVRETLGFRVREVFSVGFDAGGDELLPKSVANRLMDLDPPVGAWYARINYAIFRVRIDGDADADTLADAILVAATFGDKWERILTGEDNW